MCFGLIAGRNTTVSGAVLAGANDDWPGCPGHTHFKPHIVHTPDEYFLAIISRRRRKRMPTPIRRARMRPAHAPSPGRTE